MRRNRGAVNYAAGMATSPYSLKNMYIYGGSVLVFLTFLMGLSVTQNFEEALIYMVENYAALLLPIPWPINEAIAADTLSDFFISHILTISVGLITATVKYWMNV